MLKKNIDGKDVVVGISLSTLLKRNFIETPILTDKELFRYIIPKNIASEVIGGNGNLTSAYKILEDNILSKGVAYKQVEIVSDKGILGQIEKQILEKHNEIQECVLKNYIPPKEPLSGYGFVDKSWFDKSREDL